MLSRPAPKAPSALCRAHARTSRQGGAQRPPWRLAKWSDLIREPPYPGSLPREREGSDRPAEHAEHRRAPDLVPQFLIDITDDRDGD